MPLFDLACWDCKKLKIDVWLKSDEEITETCPECGSLLTKKAGYGSFELKYNPKTDTCDWHGDSSQYYRAYNEARARGEKVKPGDED